MTKRTLHAFLGILFLATVGCGSGQPATATPATATQAEPAHHGEQHPGMNGPVHDFHEVLAPLWHAPDGAERTVATCEGTSRLASGAAAIVAGEVPEAARGDAAGWKADAAALAASIDALAKLCAEEGRPGFGAGFGVVHEGFHKLIDRLGQKH